MSADPLAEALNDDERQGLDERIAANLWGYYLHFDATGNPAVDRVLSAVGLAAKAFHHTEAWNDDLDWTYGPIPKGETCADFIQRAANDAAAHDAQVRADERQKVDALLADEGTVEKVAGAAEGAALMYLDRDLGDTFQRGAIARAVLDVLAGLIGGEDE